MSQIDERAENIVAFAQFLIDKDVFYGEAKENLIAIRAEAIAIRALSALRDGEATEVEPVAWQWRALEDGEPKTAWKDPDLGDRPGWEALAKRNPEKYATERRALYSSFRAALTRNAEPPVAAANPEASAALVGVKNHGSLIEEYRNLVATGMEYAKGELRLAPTSVFEIYMGHFRDIGRDIEAALVATPPAPTAAVDGEVVAKITDIINRTMAVAAGKNPDVDESFQVWAKTAVDACRPYLAALKAPAPEAVAPTGTVGTPFGLSVEQIETLRSNGLKPEEIAGDQRVQAKRVSELLHWFVRLSRNSANPKWTRSHALELAYYIATTDSRAPFDIDAVERAAWLRGLQEPAEVREMAVRHGWISAPTGEGEAL
ncbi:hypothetical protein LB579_30395 [Mesorhizobium sp. BR1-1-7]|uniref:hypothetical protein n=1 Tax=Mesorhizobium sp. BR1-1-7 TaxID=2876647 RepID=UPI001CC908D4|nr:hypothetical protein [Mesorhizobium sp. BR1-1-7]MBZ9922004.1 hypothetical protein [Mesorhizobium sp. BR1-1-7]